MGSAGVIKSVLTEYGIPWVVNRSLYSAKLLLLKRIPVAERWFEHSVGEVQRLDIFDVNVDAIATFLKKMDRQMQDGLIRKADLAVEGKIWAFSSVLLDYGNPIRWNYNPITKKTASQNSKWYRIADFYKERGDIKVIWEVSRFTHFYLFSRAYLLTGDRKYYEAFHSQIVDWAEKNQYSYGPNYKCGQECSLRMVNALMNYTVFRLEGLTDEKDETAVKEIVCGSYKKVLSNFFYAYKCIKNNHTVSELLGMVIGAWCCGDMEKMAYGYRKMDEVIDEQFFADGGYQQYSFNYQRLALQDIACLESISRKTCRSISGKSREKVLRSAGLLFQMLSPDGDVPNYGSNDGALVFPVTECGYRDFRSVVQCICGLLSGERPLEAGIYDEELLWFSGKDPSELPVEKWHKKREACKEAGIYSIGMGEENAFVMLNDYKSRPGHYDQMHFELWIGTRNILCDSGTYSYADSIGRELASTAAHNTVKVSGREQMCHKGAFFDYGWTKRGRIEHKEGYFAGSMRSVNGYTHTRKVERKPIRAGNFYEITDTIRADTDGEFEVLFHTPYKVEERDGEVVISDNGEDLCLIKGRNPKIMPCKRSLYYMKYTEMKCISFHGVIRNGKALSKTIVETRNVNGQHSRNGLYRASDSLDAGIARHRGCRDGL